MSADNAVLQNKGLQLLSYYNLIGGIAGLFILAFHLPELSESALKVGGGLYAALSFGLSILSFVTYQKRQDPTLMGVMAILQLPVIRYGGLKYVLSNGVLAIFGLDASSNIGLTLDAIFEVKFSFAIANQEEWFFGVNVVPAIILWYLLMRYKPTDSAAITKPRKE
ncbi:hypothetical protein [Hymenobacter perfusus]|uniref:Uncharacterized protein n=1 Tax=Hymenobacter perfusus TaxID=1236770 RepID=A0A428JZE3_9BACT|nr:hypothetical protein [Hymenobacter perfusus]RSK39466.1 hypothetical protein EI293_19785 [Hymenobacter perfusus]